MTETIRKVAGVIVREGKLLLVRQYGQDVFLSPGGKPEQGETPVQTLARELREETGLMLVDAAKMGRFEGISPFYDRAVQIDVYLANVAGSPQPGYEIEELLWVAGDFKRYGVEVGSVFADGVLPRLVEEGLVDAMSCKTQFLAAPESGSPRVFVFDLDGTLVFNNRPLDKSIEESIHELLACGDEVVFATARAPRGVAHVLPASLLEQPTLFCNGALCLKGGQELFRRPLEPLISATIIDTLCQSGVAFQLEYGDRFYLHGDTKKFGHMLEYGYQPPPGGLDAQSRDGILKLVVAAGAEVWKSLEMLQDMLAHIEVLVHENGYIELLHKHVNKFSSFEMLMQHDERLYLVYVVFMGNDYNDFEMLVHASESLIIGTSMDAVRHVCRSTVVQNKPEEVTHLIRQYATASHASARSNGP
jgi:HAD superfamily hydrolase (TIGR01484 family)